MSTNRTTEANPPSHERLGSECECINWACANALGAHILTGHHPRCPRGGDPLKAALGLVADLAKGIERWASEEDGVPDCVWEAYRKAKALQGVFLSEDPEHGRAERLKSVRRQTLKG